MSAVGRADGIYKPLIWPSVPLLECAQLVRVDCDCGTNTRTARSIGRSTVSGAHPGGDGCAAQASVRGRTVLLFVAAVTPNQLKLHCYLFAVSRECPFVRRAKGCDLTKS